MQPIAAFIKRHPVLAYYVVAFFISWGGVVILAAPYGMPTTSEQFVKVWPIVFIPYFFGPTVAGLLMTGLVSGRAGFHTLLSRLLRWRVGIRWYAVALLATPLLVSLLLFLLSFGSNEYLPAIVTSDDRIGLLIMGLVVGFFFGGLLEELGWTGFAVPALRQRYSIFAAGLIAGLLHGLWHVLPGYWGSGDASGALIVSAFVPPLFFFAGVLPSFRILMVWVYDRTESLLLSMLMHGSLTATTLFILAPAARGTSLVIYYLILTPAVWALVALVLAANRHKAEDRIRTTYRPA